MLFREHSASELGFIIERPVIPAGKAGYESVKVPGRDGTLYRRTGTVDDISIEVSVGFKVKRELWVEQYRSLKRWLTGTGPLSFSDDPDYFYKVKKVAIKSIERKTGRLGLAKAEFLCQGYQYLQSGNFDYPYDCLSARYNPCDVAAHPIYRITGEGKCTLTVNGKSMAAQVGQNLTIDTERMLAYRQDGTLQNMAVTGDYEELYLAPGENEVNISEGFTLLVQPNWRSL